MSLGRTVTLNTGHKIPQLGYGTWQAKPGEVGDGVFEALRAGYRHLDLALIYQNQKEVAQGIKRALAETPGLKREDIFITSKLWNHQHRPEDVPKALDECLAELELSYVDLYLIHWPVAFQAGDELFPRKEGSEDEVAIDDGVTISQTWEAMTKLPKSKARSVGVSNFSIEHLETVIKHSGVVPAVNQVERHPRLPQPELVKYCKEKNIHVTAYSAFGNNPIGLPLLVSIPETQAVAGRLSDKSGKKVTPAQVILAWSQMGGHSVIPKSVTPARIRENFSEIDVSEEDLRDLDALGNERQRFNIPILYTPIWNINVFNEEKERDAKHQVVLKL